MVAPVLDDQSAQGCHPTRTPVKAYAAARSRCARAWTDARPGRQGEPCLTDEDDHHHPTRNRDQDPHRQPTSTIRVDIIIIICVE